MTELPDPILSLLEVSKSYGSGAAEVRALDRVSFSVRAGEMVALMGPSGCGKTTLLHLAGAMDRPTSGSIRLGARRLETASDRELAIARRRELGFVFQFFNLLPTLSVVENVALPLVLDGTPRATAHARAAELLAGVGLEHRRDHDPNAMSGGEMQRAAIARALAHDPCLILADEPTGSLDSKNGDRVMELLRELSERRGRTMLIATHSDEVASRCARVIRLRDGAIESDGGQPA